MVGELDLGQRDVPLGGGIGHVASVEEGVDPDRRDSVVVGPAQDLEEVADVGVDVAVRQQTDQVERPTPTDTAVDDLLPRVGLPDRTGLDGVVDPLGPLVEDASCTEDVVADFGVAHVGVGRQPHRGSVCPERSARLRRQPIECRRVGQRDGIEVVASTHTDAVHHDEHERTVATQLTCGAHGVLASSRM